jgi:hypothetical protein
MRKLLAVVAGTVCAVLVATAGHAASSHDQATGTGTLGQFGDPTAHLNANQADAASKGGFTITYPDGTSATGTATCLAVDGDTAYLTAVITEAGGPRQEPNRWFPGSYLIIGVQDRGEPGTAGPDQLNFSPGFPTDPGCGPNAAATPNLGIVAGNYHVTNAP